MIISLTGFMGSGKSSIGKVLAEKLACPFYDLDSLIEEGEGRSIPEIFSSDGEQFFRSLELKYLDSFLSGTSGSSSPISARQTPAALPEYTASRPQCPHMPVSAVLALGGGTLTVPECAVLVREKTFCIYLRATVETLVENLQGAEDGRPMLAGGSLRDKVEGLMAKRKNLYEGTAHAIIDTDGQTYEESAAAILETLATHN